METSDKHILIVDDNIKNLQLTGKILKDNGFMISLAQDGVQAIEQMKVHLPDLVLLDIMMPGMDGIEVCSAIKSEPLWKDIPVIFLTAKTQTEDLVEAFRAGGVDYITKPFNREELLVRVSNHLELAYSRKKIVELNKTRDKLYSIIAHDIRSPLAGIGMTIGVMASGSINPSSAEFRELLHLLEQSTNNTSTLLNNLLEWTKFQSGSFVINRQVHRLLPVLWECVELMRPVASAKQINLQLLPRETCQACFDEVTIHTVVRNLISNAIKFTPQGGRITVSFAPARQYVEISVADTGVGMSPELVDKIFARNEHFTSLGTMSEQGTGLGLVMVKDFVAQNRGKLEVSSIEGSGSTFRVLLPVE